MKKKIWMMMLVVLVTGISLASAENMKGGMMNKGDKESMMGDKMMGKGMMDGKMMGMCPMMQSMMQKQIVATSDGGVIVVAGNKITKYDKNLNVVKEIEQKMDMEGMQKMIENMKGMCPMMKSMMGGEDKASAETTDKGETQKAEHEGHH